MLYSACMRFTTFVALLLLSAQCVADNLKLSLQQIESEWALIYYQTPKKYKGDAFQRLLDRTTRLSGQFPNDAEPLFWQAVLTATHADYEDAISALESIKEAKDLLMTAIQMNPKAVDGSAYVTLGTLYYMAPKWPVAFGDTDKAREMLETALRINPNGIDSNYFFGDFLLANDQPAEAAKYFQRAANAPARKEQLFADNQLKAEAKNALKNALKQKQDKNKDVFLSLFNSNGIE